MGNSQTVTDNTNVRFEDPNVRFEEPNVRFEEPNVHIEDSNDTNKPSLVSACKLHIRAMTMKALIDEEILLGNKDAERFKERIDKICLETQKEYYIAKKRHFESV